MGLIVGLTFFIKKLIFQTWWKKEKKIKIIMRVWTPKPNYEIIFTFADKKWKWRETHSLRSLKWDPSDKNKNGGKIKKTSLAGNWKKMGAESLGSSLGVISGMFPGWKLGVPLGGSPASLNQIWESNWPLSQLWCKNVPRH